MTKSARWARTVRGDRNHSACREARCASRGRFVRAGPHRADHARERLAGAAARRGLPKGEGERAAASPDLLERRFAADAPNRKWIADFTSIWTAEGWLDVAAVIDLFSRRVVGWSMQASMTAQRVTDALVMAIWRRGKPDALLHHSDQGSHYTSETCQRRMAEHGVTCSMKRAFHSTSFTSRRCRASLRSRVPSDVKIMLRPMAATQSVGTHRR